MSEQDLVAEIRDANLSYLMLAQQMIRHDKAMATFRLGISEDIADLLVSFNNVQILKLANAPMMLTRFRFDDTAILGILTNHSKDADLSSKHSTILMSGQAVEDIT